MFEEVGSQAISYTTGVPAMIGTMLMLEKKMVPTRCMEYGTI